MTKPFNLLVVDDDELDAEALTRVLRNEDIHCPIFRAADGEEALQMLRHDPNAPNPVPMPAFVLLDLNMPRMNGFEFLEAIRDDANAAIRRLIVFVLTTSESDEDKCTAYDSHIAGYIVKAPQGRNFTELTNLIKQYQQLVELP